MIELVMKDTYKGRRFWITKHEIEELPELNLIPHEWYCGYVANEPMKFKSDTDDVSEDIPTSDSPIEEIYKWLDEKGIDYSRNSSKEKLLALIMKLEMEKTF